MMQVGARVVPAGRTGARLVQRARVVAVDAVAEKLEKARALGAACSACHKDYRAKEF